MFDEILQEGDWWGGLAHRGTLKQARGTVLPPEDSESIVLYLLGRLVQCPPWHTPYRESAIWSLWQVNTELLYFHTGRGRNCMPPRRWELWSLHSKVLPCTDFPVLLPPRDPNSMKSNCFYKIWFWSATVASTSSYVNLLWDPTHPLFIKIDYL